MYTISVQILGEHQIMRVNPELVLSLRRQLIATAEVQGATFHEHSAGTWLFAFQRSDADDRQGVVETTLHFHQFLFARSSELSGWLVYVDFSALPIRETISSAIHALSAVFLDDLVVLSDQARPMLDSHLAVEQIAVGRQQLTVVTGRHEDAAPLSGSVYQLALNESTVDQLVEFLSCAAQTVAPVLLTSADPSMGRANARRAQEILVSADPAAPPLIGEFAGDADFSSISTLFDSLNVHQTPFWLTGAEQAVWSTVAASVSYLQHPASTMLVPDALGIDLYLALDLYLKSYARRMAHYLSVPLVVCHDIDRWDQASLDLFFRATGRQSGDGAAAILCTAGRVSGSGVSGLEYQRVRAGTVTVSRIRDYLGQIGLPGWGDSVNWQRISRVCGGRADTAVHYLADSRYWDELEEQKIHEIGVADVAWRAVSRQDSDVREVLLALCYLSPVLSKEGFVTVAGSLGLDSARLPAVLNHLQNLGLVTGERWLHPVHPELRRRLEINLGTSARTVSERVGEALYTEVQEGRVAATLSVIEVLRECSQYQAIPAVYGRMIRRMIDRHEPAHAHRALYDSVPAAAFGARVRGAMQGVLLTHRLRLALLQQNRQAGVRALSSLEGGEVTLLPGDTVLFRSRAAKDQGDMKRCVALLKQATVEYQDHGDEVGLARANLDYGMLRLAQEDLAGGHEYIRMAAMTADDTNDVVEQLRARRLLVTTEFILGNLSRSNDLAHALLDRATAAGMHELELFASLAIARSAFELGRYEEAATVFGRGRMLARLYGLNNAEQVMQRWTTRCQVYEGRLSRAIEVFSNSAVSPEALLFLAEALLRRGDHTETLQVLDQALELETATAVTPEAISWATGFASMEDLAIGVVRGDRVLRNQINALHGYVLAESGEREQGLHEMYRLTHDMGMSDLDPHNRVYFYLYSLIIPESGELRLEDPGTVVGKAVRYLQQRSSRMELYDDKTDYLRRNYWNALLMGRAQVHNLV